MLRLFRWIGRRLGLVRLTTGGELRGPVSIHVHPHVAPNVVALRNWIEEESRRRAVMNKRRCADPRFARDYSFGPAPTRDAADRRLQLAAEQFAAVVIDALQNG